MKVKNVINGLKKKYELEEINIIAMDDEKVIYSGSPTDGWDNASIDMVLFKKQVEEKEVKQRIMFNSRKAFIFV